MRTTKFYLILALLLLSAYMLSGAALAQTNNSVIIQDFAFQPNILTVPVGTTVTWTNHDNAQHEVISDNGTFDSGILMPNGQFSYTFSQPGNYSYYCKIHTYMFGQIQVTQGSSTLKIMSSDPGSDPTQSTVLSYTMYSQYYSMPSGSPPKTHISPPKNYPLKNLGSTYVYFTIPKFTTTYTQTYAMPSNQYQVYSMPYSQYQTNYATYSGSTSLWVQGTSGLTQYVTVPQGSSLSIVAISPTGGNGYLYEIAPGGRLNMNGNYFYQYNQMDFYADTAGQHILLIVINDKVSNAIIINVVSPSPPIYNQPSYPQTSYQQPGYSQTSSNYQPSSSSQTPGY